MLSSNMAEALERHRRFLDAYIEMDYQERQFEGFQPSVAPITIHPDSDDYELCGHCRNLPEYCLGEISCDGGV